MKPVSISHANVFYDNTKDVLLNIELSKEDKERLHTQHIKNAMPDYDFNDVGMLARVAIDEENSPSFAFVCYYPATQGEIDIEVEFFSAEFCEECVEYVRNNYFGNEEKYDF